MREQPVVDADFPPGGLAWRLPGGRGLWVAVICCLVVATAVTLAVTSYN